VNLPFSERETKKINKKTPNEKMQIKSCTHQKLLLLSTRYELFDFKKSVFTVEYTVKYQEKEIRFF